MTSESIVRVEEVSHRYGSRLALDGVSFHVPKGSIFALLGPNGGGKTTLFKILSTLLTPTSGSVTVGDAPLDTDPLSIRRQIGVVFQQPSLDRKLTAMENMRFQGQLYGLTGARLKERVHHWMERCEIEDRANDLVETLSGGLQRRVELAKAMVHGPSVLVMDEPSTGLDPGARLSLMANLRELSDTVTTMLTTHLLEEADTCDSVGVLDKGKLLALDTPERLKKSVGGEVLSIDTPEPRRLADLVSEQFNLHARTTNRGLRIEHESAHEFVARLVEAFPDLIDSVKVGRPTLDDVFLRLTGHRLADAPHSGREERS